ncbi:MAG: SdrD B-like domain-containing protein [Saprospiraceae bacterium]
MDSDFTTVSYSTIISSGQKITNIDAGLYRNASIGDFVWEDSNANGIQDTGETGISNVTLTLTGNDGAGNAVTLSTTTDTNGAYAFDNLAPGNYTVTLSVPTGYNLSLPNNGNDNTDSDFIGTTMNVTLVSNQSVSNIDAGLYRNASIGDFVWEDSNANGIQDTGETGISNVTLTLTGNDGAGNAVTLSTTTDTNGAYAFDNLAPGNYTVLISLPIGYVLTQSNAGDDAIDSDFTTVSYSTIISSGQKITNIDAGLFSGSHLGDFVWEDSNANGIQDSGEKGIASIPIKLSGTTLQGQSVLMTTITDVNGHYSFSNVHFGDYTITVEIPVGFAPTIIMAGIPSNDSNLPEKSTSFSFNYASTNGDNTLDIGLVAFGSIGDVVYEDLNCNGIREAGEPGVLGTIIKAKGINLYSENIEISDTSKSDGSYAVENLLPGTYNIDITPTVGYELAQTMIQAITLQSGQNYNNYDIPIFRRMSIGDFVWNDVNENGIQDVGEQGVKDVQVKVTLLSSTGAFEATTITDNDGRWTIQNLKPGTYEVQLTVPTGYNFSSPSLGSNTSLDSDFDNSGYAKITLISGQNRSDIDAGISRPAKNSIGNFVWEDSNANGIQDFGEVGLSLMKVTLNGITSSGQIINLSTLTNFEGKYVFTDLQDGNYQISVEKSQEQYFTLYNLGSSALNSDIDPSTGKTPTITLAGGQTKDDIDIGLYKLGGIGDYVWIDENKDGVQSFFEGGFEGATLTLLDEDFNAISTLTTGFGGFYLFSDIVPGQYYIEASLPSGYTFTLQDQTFDDEDSDFGLTNGRILTPLLAINSGFINTDIDLGLIESKTEISGFTWIDNNGDGQYAGNDVIIEGVEVSLFDGSGVKIIVDTTDVNGAYKFQNLVPGTYEIRFAASDSLTITYAYIGDYLTDSDIDIPSTLSTGILNVDLGQSLSGVNGGFARFSSIGDFVWVDKNEDGIQNNQETGLNGIKVKLYNEFNALVDSTFTSILPNNNIGGFYKFDSLSYGNYYVIFDSLENFRYSPQYNADDNINSNANASGKTSVFSLPPSTVLDSIDAGYVVQASITSELSGIVWVDVNNNLLKDPNETILSGVILELYDLTNTLIVATTSGVDGSYKFSNLSFGDYYIKAQKFNDKLFVPYTGLSVPNDSEFTNNFGEGTSRIINAFPGSKITEFDLGYAGKIVIGDFVWHDLNNNGLQDTGEPGISQVKVELYNSGGIKIKETQTSIDGAYTFSEIPTGRFSVFFENLDGYVYTELNNSNPQKNSKANPTTGNTTPMDMLISGSYNHIDAGYITEGTIGDFVWLDITGNGIQNANEPGINNILVELFKANGTFVDSIRTSIGPDMIKTGYYNFNKVRPGEYYLKFNIPSNYFLSNALVGDTLFDSNITGANGPFTTNTFKILLGENRNDLDAGAYLPASIGDFVWNDVNKNGFQDAGEPGMEGVTVNLFNQSGSLLATTTTNAEGFYSFNGLKQRLYYLQFTIVDGFEFTTPSTGVEPALDSDVDATGTTPLISLSHGSKLIDIDAGMYASSARLVMGTLWYDDNVNGIRDEGEALQANISTFLKNSSYQTVKSFVTNHAGMYCLSTKTYGQHFVYTDLPEDNVFTLKGNGGGSEMDSDFNEDGTSDMITLNLGVAMRYVDGGFYEKVTTDLSGVVWLDTNPNNVEDNADTKMSDIVVLCFDENKRFVKSTKTEANGVYIFRDLDPGKYYCLLPSYEDKTFILNTGTNSSNDSEFTNGYGLGTSRLVNLIGSDPTLDFDFGYKIKTNVASTVQPVISMIYPNPSLHTIYIHNENNASSVPFTLFNDSGAAVIEGHLIPGKNTINIEHLKGGQYFVVLNNDGNIETRMIVKLDY